VSDTTADNGFLTKSLTATNLASYVTARVNLNFLGDTGTGIVNLDTQNLTISGTSNEIETSASSQTLQIGLPNNVTITNNLTVSNDLTVSDDAQVDNDLSVGADLTVSGQTETNTLQVNTTASIGGDASIGGSLNVTNTLTVSDNQGDGSTIDSLLSMSNNRIINLANPINTQDAATKVYVDGLVSGGLSFKGSFRADTGEILSGGNAGAYLYNCPGGAGTRVSILTGDYYIVANTGGQFYCSGDLLNIGDSIIAVADAAADSSTVNDWAALESDNIEGTGLANTVPLWTDSQVLGNSILSQDAGATKVTISGALDVTGDLKIQNSNSKTKAIINNTEGLVPQLEFQQSGTAQWSLGQTSPVESDGRFSISQGGTLGTNEFVKITSLGGVKAKFGGSASVNELDDYEEGSYNVQFRVGSTNYDSTNWVSGGGLAWTDNSQYIKVGRKVTLFLDLEYKGIPTAISTSTAQLYLTNLPFTMAHGGGGNIAFNWYNRNNSNENPQNFGGSTRLTPNTSNQATLINLTYHEFSSTFSDWTTESMKTNYLPTTPPGGNIYVFGQFTYFTDN